MNTEEASTEPAPTCCRTLYFKIARLLLSGLDDQTCCIADIHLDGPHIATAAWITVTVNNTVIQDILDEKAS